MDNSNAAYWMNHSFREKARYTAGTFINSEKINQMEKLFKRMILAAVFLLMGFNVPSFAQTDQTSRQQIITGVVADSNQNGIQGVTVSIQESNSSTLTDASGSFSIEASANDILIFKKEGYLSTTLGLSGSTNLKISLEVAKIMAGDDDYVPVPNGIRHKRYLTGAISSIKASELPQPSTSSLTNVLSGRLPGLNVVQLGTQPGNDYSTYRIRGRNSFNDVNALVIVDGIERDLSDLDYEEVESFTVLKDAATLSWYGLRGSHGVILVTTKTGSNTESSINFNAQYGLQAPTHLVQPLNSFEYASLYNEALLNDNPSAAPRYDQTALDAYKNNSNPFLYPDNNYQEQFIKSTTPFQRYVASAQGGDNKVRYFVLFGYMHQDGLFKGGDGPDYNSNNNYKRYNFRGNVNFDVNPLLKVSVNLSGRIENRTDPAIGTTTLMGLINNTRPNAYPILNEDGTFGGTTEDQNNILGAITSNGVYQARQRVGTADAKATHRLDMLLDGLSANILLSYDTRGDYNSGFTENYRVFDATGSGNPIPYRAETPLNYRSAAYANAFRAQEIWMGFDYDKTFDVHKVNASIRGMRSEVVDFRSRTDFSQRLQRVSSRIDYSYNERYLLSVVGSYSGDDDLPPGKRYGFFPAISAGWIISDENIFSDNDLLSFLKLRASYGLTGNTEIGFGQGGLRRFPYESRYTRNLSTNAAGYQFGTGFAYTGSANELNIGNPNITWETLTTTNLGLDFNLFQNSILATIDFFKSRREGILTSASIPDIIGQATGDLNEGIVDARGIEGSLLYNKEFGKFKLTLNANYLVSKSKVIYQGGQLGIPDYQSSIGFKTGSGLYYLSDGIYQTKAEIASGPQSTLSNQILPGDIRYIDMNNDNIINANDRVRYSLGVPSYIGLGAVLKYNVFDLNMQFQGRVGEKLNVRGIIDTGPSAFNRESLNRWTPSTATTAIYPRVGIANLGNNRTNSDFWVRNADYLKLKTIEFGVTLPKSLATKIGMQNLRLYFNGFNLLTFSKLDLDVDPEIPFIGRGTTYPYIKTFSSGLTAKF